MPREYYLVGVDRPRGTPVGEMIEYIEEAVAMWKGQKHPDDPLFDMEGDAVKVKRLHLPK